MIDPRIVWDNLSFRVRKRLWFSDARRRVARYRRIFYDYRCVFVHIPKTAGDSITEALNGLPRRTGREPPVLPKHAKASEIRAAMGPAEWDACFSFTVVRNPWDLMVSSYHWWLQTAPRQKRLLDPDVRAVRRLGSFDAFVRSRYGREMINEYRGDLFDWFSEDGTVIVDAIARFETLADEWREICRRIGIAPLALPHANPTRRRPYRDYYTDETRGLVAQRFRRSIERFGYEF
jgi:hypothetical protein